MSARRTHRAVIFFAVMMLATEGIAASGREQALPPTKAALSIEARVDRVFERFNKNDTPGCVVGVAVAGKRVLVRAYGMADLEQGTRLRPDSVLESGSVAKQFTAAAIALLRQDGRLSLEDPVRKYVPELPDFGNPILIRHLLNHTSGLRDQWPLMSLSGRPTGRAVHTVAEILELVSRMKELNFLPGEEFLYNNTGYTLLGVVVARVSGKSLDEFCQERLFKPLGMSRTRWRDDFTKVVPGRATAYGQGADGTFYTNMPFTNVIGNGGLLTTAEDLLKWNENLDNPRVGGRTLVEQLETRGRLNDGFENEYAQGLMVTDYRGVREVSHGGSTAGYQAFLARYPEARVSVAVLSNLRTANPARLAHEVADIFLAGKVKEPEKIRIVPLNAEALKRFAGVYREPLTGVATLVDLDKEGKTLRVGGRPVLALSENSFIAADGSRRISFEAGTDGSPMMMRDSDGRSKPRLWEAVPPFAPKAADLEAYAGIYESDELDMTYTVYVEGGKLKLRFRPAHRFELAPAYADAFGAEENILLFTRDGTGAVDGFRVYAGRIRHLRFFRVGPN